MTKNTLKNILLNKRVRYEEKYDQYTIQLKHRRSYWWLLLLLLPLLLLIRCQKDISVSCYEPDTKAPIEDIPVKMTYQAHYLWNRGQLFATDSIARTQKTNADGETIFKDLPCSVFSYIFYCLSDASFTAKSGCHAASDEKHNFHYTNHVDLTMAPRLENLHVKMLDLETGDMLPDAMLRYKYVKDGQEKLDSAKADASGVVTLPNMRYCSTIKMLRGSCYGYADTTRTDVLCKNILLANDSTAMRLRPIKKRFTFFVKNKESKQPIPDAICTVTLKHPSGKVDSRVVHTSVDGKGIAVYQNAFVLATIGIKATKKHYKDGKLEGGPWTVEKFIEQKNDTRTVWLESEPYLVEFINIDSINGKPIPGVKNAIKIKDLKGKVESITETSNRNGIFPVTAKEGSRIEIVSTKDPEYKKKNTIIPHFKDKEKIKMQPNTLTLKFRTVTKHSRNTLYPNCTLNVRTKSGYIGKPIPTNSGGGEFEVKDVYVQDNVYITASNGSEKNNYTVNGQTMSYLAANASARDIPLPVVFNYNSPAVGDFFNNFNLSGNAPYKFRLDWYECCLGDCSFIEIISANGYRICKVGTGGNPATQTGSLTLSSPTQNIRVHVQDKNGHNCRFKITRL